MQTESITTPEPLQRRPVRMWARALAWIIVILGIPAVGFMTYDLIARDVWPGIYRVMQLAAALWLLPLFTFVAIKGRTPRSWPGVGSAAWNATSPPNRLSALIAAIRSRR
jgi:hypothetical protein